MKADSVLFQRYRAVIRAGIDMAFVVVHRYSNVSCAVDRFRKGAGLNFLNHLAPRRNHRPAFLLCHVDISGDPCSVRTDFNIHHTSVSSFCFVGGSCGGLSVCSPITETCPVLGV